MIKVSRKAAALAAACAMALAAVAGIVLVKPDATAIEYGLMNHTTVGGHVSPDPTAVEYA
jgi:hypothetical protein